MSTYRTSTAYPFCPGCGHSAVLDTLNSAFGLLSVDPRKLVLVSDIGCVGLSDQYFRVNTFHGLHGRSIAYASGIKLARPDLDVVVVMGDGGCGIGGAHLLAAARRNIGITVLVFNNLNFGMTGGQHSATTPPGGRTSTTPDGNLERPLDVCATVAVNGASWVWRGTAFDKDLPERIAEGMRSDGFALLDIWELCTAYYVPNNTYSKKALLDTLAGLGFPTGLIRSERRPEYARALRAAGDSTHTPPGPKALSVRFASSVDRRVSVVLAGSAGGRVRTAARLGLTAAVMSGLHGAQRDDYPVTVKTGHSLSEIVLDPTDVDDTSVEVPDAVVVVSSEGLAKVRKLLERLPASAEVFTLAELAKCETAARLTVLDLASVPSLPRGSTATVAMTAALVRLGYVSADALRAAAREEGRGEETLAVVEAGLRLAGDMR